MTGDNLNEIDMMILSLPLRIREIRTALFLSPRDVARKAGINKTTYYNIENGTAKNPDMLTLYKIATALKVNPPTDIFIMDDELKQIVHKAWQRMNNLDDDEENSRGELHSLELIKKLPRRLTTNTVKKAIRIAFEHLWEERGEDVTITVSDIHELLDTYISQKTKDKPEDIKEQINYEYNRLIELSVLRSNEEEVS